MAEFTQADQDLKTKRLFISAISSAFGVDDQSYANADGYAVNQPRQYTVIGANGDLGIEGASGRISAQSLMASPLFLLLLIGGGIFLATRK